MPLDQAGSASLAALEHANLMAGDNIYSSGWFGDDGQHLHYVTAGEGPIIIFVHGFPSFWYCWIRQLEALRHTHRVIAIDARGAGASARTDSVDTCRVSVLAAELHAFITEIAPNERVLLVGHDWGAVLSLTFAQTYPDVLSGVVGIAGIPLNQMLNLLESDAEQRARSDYMQRLCALTLADAAQLANTIIETAYHDLIGANSIDTSETALFARACGDPHALLSGALWYRANLPSEAASYADYAWPEANPKLDISSLLIWGEDDAVFVPHAPDQYAAAHNTAHVVLLEGIGHWCMLQAPERVNLELLEFAAHAFSGYARNTS